MKPYSGPAPRRFTIQVEDEVLDDLKERLQRTRVSASAGFDARGQVLGQEQVLQDSLIEYWRNDYDWRKHEAELNSLSHFLVKVQGLDIHYVHERSHVQGAVPLLLIHGWPGSVWEFHKVIPQLTRPTNRALRMKQAFHVIAPSIPGYGWSEALKEPGMNVVKVASIFNELMRKLGYQQYMVQGGDWGSIIGQQLAYDYPSHAVMFHSNMPILSIQNSFRLFMTALQALVDFIPGVNRLTLKESEREGIRKMMHIFKTGAGFLHLQATQPHTPGFALSDSPAGLLAWIGEKMDAWTDGAGNVLNALSKDDILTNVMIYWTTNTIASSMRLYYEYVRSVRLSPEKQPGYVQVPTGLALFPGEILQVPKKWISWHYNVVHVTEFTEGGHFAAWEQPELFVQDLRMFAFHSITFDKACQLAVEREKRESLKKPSDLKTNLLLFAPVLPTPAVASLAAYMLYSKL